MHGWKDSALQQQPALHRSGTGASTIGFDSRVYAFVVICKGGLLQPENNDPFLNEHGALEQNNK